MFFVARDRINAYNLDVNCRQATLFVWGMIVSTKNTDKLLRQLLEIGQKMAETRALVPLLRYAVDVAMELLNAECGFLVLTNSDGTLDFRVARDQHGNKILDPDRQISRTILYRVINTRQYRRIASAISDESFSDSSSVTELELKSVLCVPLISQGTPLGVIYLENRNAHGVFTESDVQPLLYLAGHAAVCIQNAILNEQLQEQAHQRMDELTRLSMEGELPSDVVKNVADQERNRILYNFIRDASHQFRTPLTVIKTTVDLLSRKLDLDHFGNYLDRIAEQVDSIVVLVESLNLLAKLDSDVERTFHFGDLTQLVYDMWEVMVQRAQDKNIELIEPSMETQIRLALIQTFARQAIGKVLENAIAYTEPGGAIKIFIEETTSTASVIIEDTGIGISPEDLPQVTTRFYRADKTGTDTWIRFGLIHCQSNHDDSWR